MFWEKKQQRCGVDESNLLIARHQKATRRYKVGSSAPDAQISVEAYYTIQTIQQRFDQEGYRTLCRLEAMLCNLFYSKLE